MIEKVAEIDKNELRTITREIASQVEVLVAKLNVTYTQSIVNKLTIATFYLTNKETNRRHVIATGEANVFFEENNVPALGEKRAYDDGLIKARKFLEDYVFFRHFENSTTVNNPVLPIKNI